MAPSAKNGRARLVDRMDNRSRIGRRSGLFDRFQYFACALSRKSASICFVSTRRDNALPIVVRSGKNLSVLLPIIAFESSINMAETIQTLQAKMEAAALDLDFEEAKRCRDKINLMRGGATADEADKADFTGVVRQQPGAMGLGSSQQRVTPPAGWKPPAKPDMMTSGVGPHRKRNK